MIERRARELVKIMPYRYRTLRECVIASFGVNGSMSDEDLYRSLPHFAKGHIKRVVAELPDELTGR